MTLRRRPFPPKPTCLVWLFLNAGFGLLAGALLSHGREWQTEPGCRWAELQVPTAGSPGFTLLTPDHTGIAFSNLLDEARGTANRILPNGSGLAVGDYDNDGLPDIFFCGLDSAPRLYRNRGGFKFQDVTERAGLTWTNKDTRGAVFADIDADGWLDLLVSSHGRGVICWLNTGHGSFTNLTGSAGTGSAYGSFTAALADVDGNGTLDLCVGNYHTDDVHDHPQVDVFLWRAGKPVLAQRFRDQITMLDGSLFQVGEPNLLLLNDGHGRFSPAPWAGGRFLDEAGQPLAKPTLDWTLTVTFRDLNGDGCPDIYECNDYRSPDRIWINDGKGNFRAIQTMALRHTSASSMGVDFADIDRDGLVDFFVLDMLGRDLRSRKRQMLAQKPVNRAAAMIEGRPQVMRNTLFHNRGDGTFEEIADYAGVPASDWSWSPVFLDIDLDGYEDLLIATGHLKDVQDLDAVREVNASPHTWNNLPGVEARQREFSRQLMLNWRLYPQFQTPIVAYRNLGNLKFDDVTKLWGTDQPGVHHGLAMADLDGDGAMDLVVNNLGSVAAVYRNNTGAPRVAVRLKGLAPNTQGIGSIVKLFGGAVPMQSHEIICGGRYLSGSEPMVAFAAGRATNNMRIEVAWRSGKVSLIDTVRPNRLYEIDEAGASPAPKVPPPTPVTAHFREATSLLGHTHYDEPFDDFKRQPLLPKRLSQGGPGVAWFDLNGDGHEDLVVGSGKDGALAVFYGDGKGGFKKAEDRILDTAPPRDQTTVLGWHGPAGRKIILTGLANYEDGSPDGASVRQYLLADGTLDDTLTGQASSTGPLALADMDGDGQLELFVGGRVVPGRYPEPATSRLFRHDGQKWTLEEANSRPLEKAGLVSGAVWSDLDNDGFPELILACEWGPLRVFKNNAGKLVEATAELGLDAFTGWWNGVATGDLDGDGRLDILASNWGLNSPYKATPEKPVRLYYGDFAGQGTVDLIETDYDAESGAVTPRRSMTALGPALPFLAAQFPTHKEYIEASLAKVLGDRMARAQEAKATTLASMVFLNRGKHFEAVPMPAQAQWAPAFAVCVGDLDGDGHEDVFLSQNFFETQPEVPRLDAGRSLWLRGDGTGRLLPVPGQLSGLKVYGNQRGAALGDFNEDGRTDIVVTQNGAATCLFENVSAKPGLRLRLIGPPGNPAGVGAVVRLADGAGRFGAAREIHAGSGYWSQDSAVQILTASFEAKEIQVRWPGGRLTTASIPAGAREIKVDKDGAVGSDSLKRP